MKHLSISPVLRVCVDSNNVFFQQRKTSLDKWKTTNLPMFYFSDERDKKETKNVNDILKEIEGTEFYKTLYESEKHVESYYVEKSIIQELQNFIDDNVSWANKIDVNEDLVDGFAREIYGISCPENIDPLVRLILACNVTLEELGTKEQAFDDGFYSTTSIIPVRSLLASKDLKTAIKELMGTYSKNISREIKNALYGDINAMYKLSLLSFLRGMNQENILKVLTNGEMLSDKVFDKFQFNSYKVDDKGFAILPRWFLQAPEKYKVEWMLDDFEMMVECILLTGENEDNFSEVDFNTKNIYLVHNRIVDVINYHFTLDNLELANNVSPVETHDVGNIDGIEYNVLHSALDLACVGKTMNVCVGSEPYYKRLSSGSSVFLHGSVKDEESSNILAEIDVKTRKIIEVRGNSNSDVSESDREKTLLAIDKMFKDESSVLVDKELSLSM